MKAIGIIAILFIGIFLFAGCSSPDDGNGDTGTNGDTGNGGSAQMIECGTTTATGDAASVCFEDAWADCKKAKVIFYATIMEMTTKTYYEIKSGTPESCTFYTEVLESTAFAELVGKDMTCTGIDATSTTFAEMDPTTTDKCTGSLMTA